jgi:MFS family permease
MVRVFGYGVVCFAAAYAAFAITGGVALLAAGFVVAGIGIGLVETAEHAAVATFAPDEIRGSAFGFLAALQSFGNLAASAVVGVLYTVASPSIAFAYASVLMVIAVVLLLGTNRPARSTGAERAERSG